MGYLPYDAPPPKERAFENIARCTVNRIIRLGDAVGLKGRLNSLPEGADPSAPYWDLVFETIDARYSDGNPLMIVDSTKLTDRNGEWLDNTQRPYLISAAFAGLQIRVVPFTEEVRAAFPAFDMGVDPAYDESAVVGRVFRLRATKLTNRKGEQIGRELYIPVEAFAPDFVYTGEVRTVTSSKSGDGVAVNSNGAVAPASIDIAADETARAQVAAALTGTPADDDAVISVLRTANLGNLSLNGQRFLDLLADERLVASLADAGVVRVNGDVLVSA